MYSAYVTVIDPRWGRLSRRRLAVLSAAEAPGIAAHATVGTHLGHPVLRIRSRWADDFRASYTAVMSAVRACGYEPIADLTARADRAIPPVPGAER